METSARSLSTRPEVSHSQRREHCELPDYDAIGVPAQVAAALEAVRFCDRSTKRLRAIPLQEWPQFVVWAESRQIALTIAGLSGDRLPATEREVLARRAEAFRGRMVKIREALREISLALGGEGIPFVVLKGFTHSPELTPNPAWRAQGDIDIWCIGANAATAFQVLRKLGYIATRSHSKRHLPPLARAQNWKWDGNQASIPISVEIHEHLWDPHNQYEGTPDENQIWNRTVQRTFQGDLYRVLRTDDLVSFAAFHLFLHLVNGDLPLQRAWEIANFLHSRADDNAYWESWHSSRSTHWTIELLVFRLIKRWFSCRLPARVIEGSENLPDDTLFWLREFTFEPLIAQKNSNKNYIWLNCSVLHRRRDRFAATRKCFIPVGLPTFVDGLNTPGEPLIYKLIRQRHHLLSRARRHVRALYPTLKGGLAWAGHKCGLVRRECRF